MALFLLVSQAWAQPVVRLKARAAGARPIQDVAAARTRHALPVAISYGTRSGDAPRTGAARHARAAIRAGCGADGGLPGGARSGRAGGAFGRRDGAIRQDQPPAGGPGDGSAAGGVPPGCGYGHGARCRCARAVSTCWKTPALLAGHLVVSGPHSALGALAECDDVAYIMPASAELAAGIPLAGCAGAATEAGPVGEYVLVSRGWPQGCRRKCRAALFHPLADGQDGCGHGPVRNRAGASRVDAVRQFHAVAGAAAGGRTDAGHPVRPRCAWRRLPVRRRRAGRWRIPSIPRRRTPEPIAGDLHLDADEPWRSGANVDLYSVALHEAGHALGLGHSDRPGAVMYPYYKLSTGLTDDDIAGIRALYGSNVPPPPTPRRQRQRPPRRPPPAPTPTPAPPAGTGRHHSAIATDQVAGIHHHLDHRLLHRNQRDGERQRRGHGRQMDQLDGRGRGGGGNGVLVGQHSPAGGYQCDYGACLRCGRQLGVAGAHGGQTLMPPGFCLRTVMFSEILPI